jgi:hypothetical protein
MRKRIIIGKIYDPGVNCGHAGMEIETILGYDGEEVRNSGNLQDELLDFEGQRVRITIEEIDATPG